MQQSNEGQERIKRQMDRENEFFATRLEQQEREDEKATKMQNMEPVSSPEAGGERSLRRLRVPKQEGS